MKKVIPACILVLVLCEVCLRFIYPKEVRSLIFQFDADCLMALKPGAVSYKDGIRFETNRDGFRGAPLQKAPKTRIVVYGDSNVMARFSNLEKTFPYLLEEKLKQSAGEGVEVINAGIAGYGPDQSLLRFKKEAEALKPQVAIFVLYTRNDFGDLIRNRIFEIDDKGILKRSDSPATLDDFIKDSQGVRGFVSRLLIVRGAQSVLSFGKKTEESSGRSWTDLEPERLLQVCEEEFKIYQARLPRKYSLLYDHWDIDVALHPEKQSSIEKVRLMAAVLKETSDFARSKNIKLVGIILPTKADFFNEKGLPTFHGKYVSEILDGMLKAQGVASLNLFEAFSENDPKRLFRSGNDDHWSDEGQALAAEKMAEYFQAI